MKTSAKQIAVKFQKLRGNNPHARKWEEFPLAEQLAMLEGVELEVGEAPVVGIAGKLYPIVITTKRIIWRPDNFPHDLLFAEIAKLDAPHARISKLDTSELHITMSAGEVHQVQTEPGKTLFILWNLLLNVMPHSARMQPRA